MIARRILPTLGLVFLLLPIVPLLAPLGTQAGPPEPVSIDPLILEQMASAADGQTGFFVRFREEADLSPAYAIQDWNRRGQFVYDTLRATAEQSQANVRSWLNAHGIAYEPIIGLNALF